MRDRIYLVGTVIGVLWVLFGLGCSNGTPGHGGVAREGLDDMGGGIYRTALAEPAGSSGFTRLGQENTGIDFRNVVSDRQSIVEQTSINSGLAAGDYDNDGDLDLYLLGLDPDNKLYRNDGGFRFTDVTAAAGEGLAASGNWGSGAAFADVNGDGHLDLYACYRNAPNQLFIGDGAGHFVEDGGNRGVDDSRASVTGSFFDAENDGDLDLYVANYNITKDTAGLEPYRAEFEQTGKTSLPPDLSDRFRLDERGYPRQSPHADAFLVNDGQGNFADRTAEAGFTYLGWSYQAQACDFNNDGWIDLYVTSDFETKDRYYLNQRDGTFVDVAPTHVRKTALFGMGADSGDINGDGLPDLFVADMLSRSYKRAKKQSGDMNTWRWEMLNQEPQPQMRNMLYLNRGDGWMTEMAQLCGVHASEWTWSARIADLNCDGIPEIFCTTGNLMDSMDVDFNIEYARMKTMGVPFEQRSQMILDAPPLHTDNVIFTASSPLAYGTADGNWGMLDSAIGCGCVLQDFDNDGDRDIIVNSTNADIGVWRNDFTGGNRLVVELRQPGSNPFGVGARLWAHCADDIYMQDIIISRGFASGESHFALFGLAEHQAVDKLVIRWPDRMEQIVEGLDAGYHYVIERSDTVAPWQPAEPDTLFEQANVDWLQQEVNTQADEFAVEPLLPMLQSTLGTGVGVADYDGDGNLDAYFCGAAGQHGQLFRGDGSGGFAEDPALAGVLDPAAEEMCALWFEANQDGRPDLLITAGGNESPEGSAAYEDVLLLNLETGFEKVKLPHKATSTAAAAANDIDGDGDLDLVIAGHVVPKVYAATAPSYVLLNQGAGSFTDATAAWAGELGSGGQITDLQFSDLDGDRFPELLVSRKWGAVEYWSAREGRLARAGELTPAGWWTGLGTGDFDNDGDIDVICGNFGANLKYHPKPESPVTLFANDVDGNGSRDLIEVKYRSDGCMLPGRGRSCSGYAISYIPVRFPTWDSFANATLEDIYGPGLEGAERFDATELHSVVCINDGSGSFAMQELPRSAQWAPVFGIGVADLNCDGYLDCYLANNFYWTQPETGHWDTGYGVVLLGDGSGGFTDLEPTQSGIRMYEDGRGVVAADFSGDGRPDLAVSASDGRPVIATNAASGGQTLEVSLSGTPGNPAGVGAQLVLALDNGTELLREVHAGQGYLSSYGGNVHFAIPDGQQPVQLTVYWPGGDVTEITDGLSGSVMVEI